MSTAAVQAPTYVAAVRETLAWLLEHDDRVILLGEDIGAAGGSFKATRGLQERFGPERVRDTPISEDAFTGVAIGLALDGLRPIVEYQFADFLTSGFTQLVDFAAKLYYRTGLAVPLVVRAPAGGGFSGGPFHSECPEAWFLHAPGIKVACPATPADASQLLRAAVLDENPVLLLEQKHLYTRVRGAIDLAAPVPPLAGAAVRRPGRDVTAVTWGATLHLALAAAEACAAQGVEVEVIDLRVLCPLDWPTVLASVRRTGRALVAHEAHLDFGPGAELAARIADEAFADLDAPPRRVGAAFHPIPFSRPLEEGALPSSASIAAALLDLAAW